MSQQIIDKRSKDEINYKELYLEVNAKVRKYEIESIHHQKQIRYLESTLKGMKKN